MRLDDTVVGCRMQECNMDVVIIYKREFLSVQENKDASIVSHWHLSQHRGK